MVKPERYKFQTPTKNVALPSIPPDISRMTTRCRVESLERKSNGSWYAATQIDLRFELKDGRAVVAQHVIRLRGAQEGKRPNPNLFGKATKTRKAREGKRKAGK